MKKQLIMTTAMAAGLAALGACSSNSGWEDEPIAESDTAVCVNQDGERVDDDLCGDNPHHVSGGGSNAFLWYYLGRSSAIPYYGDSIRHSRYRGSYTPQRNAFYVPAPASTGITRSQAVSRGGLGSSSRSYGGRGS